MLILHKKMQLKSWIILINRANIRDYHATRAKPTRQGVRADFATAKSGFKRILSLIFLMLFIVSISGCAVLIAGAVGGIGTSTWLSGKLNQEVNVSSERTLKAVKSTLKFFKFDINKETKQKDVIQVISSYTDGRKIWIDIRPVTQSSSRIEVRVGAMGDKEAARKILDKVLSYL